MKEANFEVNSHKYYEDIDTMAKKLIEEIQCTPPDGILILNILKESTNEKIMSIQRNMENLAKQLNRQDIDIVVTSKNAVN